MSDKNETLDEALARCSKMAREDMEANKEAGRAVQGVGVVTVPVAPGESPNPVVLFDKRVAVLRERVVSGKVKLVTFQTVEEGDDDSSFQGTAEVLTDSKALDQRTLLWAVQNDLPGLLANNLYEAVGRAIQEQIKSVVDHAFQHIARAQKAGDN